MYATEITYFLVNRLKVFFNGKFRRLRLYYLSLPYNLIVGVINHNIFKPNYMIIPNFSIVFEVLILNYIALIHTIHYCLTIWLSEIEIRIFLSQTIRQFLTFSLHVDFLISNNNNPLYIKKNKTIQSVINHFPSTATKPELSHPGYLSENLHEIREIGELHLNFSWQLREANCAFVSSGTRSFYLTSITETQQPLAPVKPVSYRVLLSW